jgi:uncharacterized membrane protein SpoIIM required for sporulation
MKEVAFLHQNMAKWQGYEKELSNLEYLSSDKLSNMYIELIEDLSHAQSFYPNSQSTNYLNSLTIRVFEELAKTKKEERGRFVHFWKTELPGLYYSSRKLLLFAFVVFFTGVTIGWISSATDDRFVRLILGDSYVNMTIDNIKSNDPMAVYKKANEVEMFFGITYNNIRVSLNAFILGLLFGLGTFYVLFTNGIMLGTFQYLFYKYDLLTESLLTVWIHGMPEISAIILSGAAGFVIARSFMFPGSFPRGYAFKEGAKKGLKMVLGLIPIFIFAGFLEGFVTRHTELPDALRIAIIMFSFAAIVYYFFILPLKLNRKGQKDGRPNV